MLIYSTNASLSRFTKIFLVTADAGIMVLPLFHCATLHRLGVQKLLGAHWSW